MTSTNTSWRFEDLSEDLRIFRNDSFPDCHCSIYTSGDYHSSYDKNPTAMHYGYCNKKFRIEGGRKLKTLFFMFESDLLKGLIPLSKSLFENLIIKEEREKCQSTPLEAYFKNAEKKRKAPKRRISSPKNLRNKKRKLSE